MEKNIEASRFVKDLKEYKTASQQVWRLEKEYRQSVIKADWNESMVPPSPKVIKSLVDFIKKAPLNWYPDVCSNELKSALEHYTNMPEEYIETFNGSDAALEYVVRAFLNPGDEVIIRVPTYDNFRVYAESCGAKVKNVFCSSPFTFEAEKIIESITDRTKIIYLVNPNNPTGAVMNEAQLKSILDRASNILVIVDEAYYEFYNITMCPFIKKYNNLLITRSFSKAFSLAGLRCGYIITAPKNIKIIDKIRVGKNTNSLAQFAAKVALDDLEYTKKYVQEVREAKNWAVSELNRLGFEAITTKANFILIKIDDPSALTTFLEKNGIYIRNISSQPQLENFVRITVGPQKIMEEVVKKIKLFGKKK